MTQPPDSAEPRSRPAFTRRKFLLGAGAAAVAAAAGGGFAWSRRFGRMPSGARLERIHASPNWRNGAFRNQEPSPPPVAAKGRTSLFDVFFHPSRLRQIPVKGDIPAEKNDLSNLPPDALVWFGHSSYLLRTGGKTVLADPVFRRGAPVPFIVEPFPGTDLYSAADMPAVDCLLITHDHWDHLEYSTVCELKDRVARVVCPLGVGEHFEYWGWAPEKITELDWGETASLPGIEIACLPSRHFSGRGFKRNQTLWCSYMVNRVYFGGDGGYDGRFARIAAAFPRIELALIENGQYNEAWSSIHTLPGQLPAVVHDLRARRYFAGHNSKFCLSTHPWDEPRRNMEIAMQGVDAEALEPAIGRIHRL